MNGFSGNAGQGGDSIGFEPHAPFAQSEVRILKICEGRDCGKTFTALRMAPVKLCLQCREREEAAQTAADQPIPDALAPEEIIQNWVHPRNKNALEAARHALSLRETA